MSRYDIQEELARVRMSFLLGQRGLWYLVGDRSWQESVACALDLPLVLQIYLDDDPRVAIPWFRFLNWNRTRFINHGLILGLSLDLYARATVFADLWTCRTGVIFQTLTTALDEHLERVYTHCEADDPDSALDLVLKVIDDLLEAGRFAKIDELLDAVDLSRMDISTALGFLSATLAARDKLSARSEYAKRVRAHFVGVEHVDVLLRGLEQVR